MELPEALVMLGCLRAQNAFALICLLRALPSHSVHFAREVCAARAAQRTLTSENILRENSIFATCLSYFFGIK
ncbi:hypothetical protein D6817_04890 [Candidatus Pacearchaeota archaeon]|nr:MAG: hypothetical protein D6817_04890 [Candidatus Pacearchaeota archaeon]